MVSALSKLVMMLSSWNRQTVCLNRLILTVPTWAHQKPGGPRIVQLERSCPECLSPLPPSFCALLRFARKRDCEVWVWSECYTFCLSHPTQTRLWLFVTNHHSFFREPLPGRNFESVTDRVAVNHHHYTCPLPCASLVVGVGVGVVCARKAATMAQATAPEVSATDAAPSVVPKVPCGCLMCMH